jgi:hypothetical protein
MKLTENSIEDLKKEMPLLLHKQHVETRTE